MSFGIATYDVNGTQVFTHNSTTAFVVGTASITLTGAQNTQTVTIANMVDSDFIYITYEGPMIHSFYITRSGDTVTVTRNIWNSPTNSNTMYVIVVARIP